MSNNAWEGSESPSGTPRLEVATENDANHSEEEGGLWAWLSVLGSFLVYFASFGVINSFGFFQNYYQHDFLSDYSPAVIAIIGTLQISLMYLVGPVAGTLSDCYGPQYLYPFAAVTCSGSLIALSFTHPQAIWQQFLCQGILFGIAVGFGFRPATTIVSQYFTRRQALAMGIVAGGSSVGGVCFPIMFARLVPKIGFAWSVRVAALILLCCFATAFFFTRPPGPGHPLAALKDLLDFNGYLDVRYATLSIGVFVGNLGLYLPYYTESYATFIDPASNIRGYLLPLLNGTSFFGRIIGGQAADKMGRLNILFPMVILSGVFCLAMWLPASTIETVIAFISLYGFCSGVFISVTNAAVAQILPREKQGARQGAFFVLTAVATLIGSPIGGALIKSESRAGYQPMIIFSGCTLLAGGAIIAISRFFHNRNLAGCI